MKLSSFCPEFCFKTVFKNAAAGSNLRCCSVLNSARYELQVLLTVTAAATAGSRSRNVTCDALLA